MSTRHERYEKNEVYAATTGGCLDKDGIAAKGVGVVEG